MLKDEKILGVKINTGLDMTKAVNFIFQLLNDDKYHTVSTTNPEFIMSAQEDACFKDIINNSDLSLPDGSGVLYALTYLAKVREFKKNLLLPIRAFAYGASLGVGSLFNSGIRNELLGEKISGVDLVYKICEYAAKENKTVFLLGGREKDFLGKPKKLGQLGPDLATKTSQKLIQLYPNLKIVGATSSFSASEEDDQKTLKYIHDCMVSTNSDPVDFMFVAYGHPKQEKWIARNANLILCKVSIGVGGAFEYISNTRSRGPKVFISMNLEWLYRLVTQPWRLNRIRRAFPIFPLKVYLESIN